MESEECDEIKTNLDENIEVKQEVLDLTVQFECRLTEVDDDDDGSLSLEEECVDPLEFLEVDQSSMTESVEEEEEDSPVSVNSPAEEKKPPVDQITVKEENEGRDPLTNVQDCGYLKSIKKNCTSKEINENNEDQFLCDCEEDMHECKICNKLVNLFAYDSHVKRHKLIRKHKCDTCDKAFYSPIHLRAHLNTHVEGNVYTCDNCGKTFNLSKSLKNHRYACTKKKCYQCKQCGESFSQKKPLLNHLRKHEKVPEEKLNCEICCIMFDTSSSKKEHIVQVHVAAQRFVCGTCGEAFVTESAMKRHIAKHSRSYPCKVCDATFTVRRELNRHNVQHRSLKDLRCKCCGQQFEEIAAYSEHKLAQSCSDHTSICELCNKTFKDKTALKKHIMVHVPLSERSVSCDICNRNFCGPSALKKHIRLIHADARPYTCEFCSKSFNQLCKLKYHIISHASDKPVTCDICQKKFSSEKDIRIHMRTHTGERPFKCNLCDKSFRQRGHVKTHQLVHTKEKPFSCELCDKSFGLSSSLKKHMRLHTSESLITNL